MITANLIVDLDNVRARYECLLCGAKAGPVFGTEDVRAFTATIRNDHHALCTTGAPQAGGAP